MSNGHLERITSHIYEDLGPVITAQPVRRGTTTPTTRSPTLKIKARQSPVEKSPNDATPRKAPSPPTPIMSISLKSSSSMRTLRVREDEKDQMEKFQFFQSPIDEPKATLRDTDEVVLLRKRIELLEMKLEELQSTVRTLQWHSDPQRQAALEDWAIEKLISVYNQFFPQPKSTIAELVRLFAASKQKSVLTDMELEYLSSLPRIRDMKVQNFMLTPPWFDQTREKDVKEIARYVVKQRDSELRKRNQRLYRFATGRSPKSDAKPS